jgi:hypothetical protein
VEWGFIISDFQFLFSIFFSSSFSCYSKYMSEAGGEIAHEPPAKAEAGHETNETTKVSNAWMNKTKNLVVGSVKYGFLSWLSEKFVRGGANFVAESAVARGTLKEFFKNVLQTPQYLDIKSQLDPVVLQEMSKGINILTNIPLAGVALGVLGGTVGSAIGWQGVKHSKYGMEKFLYWGVKAASIGLPVLATVFPPAAAYIPLARGLSLASTLIGFRHNFKK